MECGGGAVFRLNETGATYTLDSDLSCLDEWNGIGDITGFDPGIFIVNGTNIEIDCNGYTITSSRPLVFAVAPEPGRFSPSLMGPYTIRNCNFVSVSSPTRSANAIGVEGGTVLIENVQVTTSSSFTGKGRGITAISSQQPIDLTVRDTTMFDIGSGAAIMAFGQPIKLVAENVSLKSNNGHGFFVSGQFVDMTLKNCIINGHGEEGLDFRASDSNLTISDSLFCNNGGALDIYFPLEEPNGMYSNVTCLESFPKPGNPQICQSNACPGP